MQTGAQISTQRPTLISKHGVCYLFSLKNCFLIVIRVCHVISNIKAVQKRQHLFSDDRREGENKCLLTENSKIQ